MLCERNECNKQKKKELIRHNWEPEIFFLEEVFHTIVQSLENKIEIVNSSLSDSRWQKKTNYKKKFYSGNKYDF